MLPKTYLFPARVDATIRAEDSFCNPLESAADDNSVEILAIFAERSKQNRAMTKAKLLMLMIKLLLKATTAALMMAVSKNAQRASPVSVYG